MTDLALINGQPARDASGRRVTLRGTDALVQRARLCLAAKRGSFVYDRNLGSDLAAEDGLTVQRAQILAGEALAKYADTAAEVLGLRDGILTVRFTIGSENVTEEVRINGTL